MRAERLTMIGDLYDGDDGDDNAGKYHDGYPRWGQKDWPSVSGSEGIEVANLPPALMWRYIGTAITDGEFGVLQSKLNLFQIAPPSPCKPPWGPLWSRGSSQTFWYRPTSTYSFDEQRLSFWIIRKKYNIIIITIGIFYAKNRDSNALSLGDEEHVNWL